MKGDNSSERLATEGEVNVDALLAAINEISESEIHRVEGEDGRRVSVDGRDYHTWRELAEAFELDVRDFSSTEANR
nr:YodD family peroxide/acid resistance protein [uncultured Enterobacter sp.]